MRDYIINPVLYVEYENISGADKTLLEVVGHDGQSDFAEPNGESRRSTSTKPNSNSSSHRTPRLEHLRKLHC